MDDLGFTAGSITALCMFYTFLLNEVTKDDTTGSAGATTGSIDPVCGESAYYGSYGVISSPNYPGYYYNNLYCDYYVYAETGSSLSFIFSSFYTEQCCDYVTISCASNSNFPPHEYSGDMLPEALSISPCSQARINFRTDYSVVSSGFSVDYYVSDAGCGTTVYTGVNGFVNSPNWPEFYGYNKNCSNIIWTPIQSRIELYFRSFNLQDDCNSDWLEISCLDNSEVGLQRYCGSYQPFGIYIYNCSQVLLWFHSDDTSNAQGFLIEYTIYPADGQNVSSNDKPHAAQNVPINEKPLAEQQKYHSYNGIPLSAQPVPGNGGPLASENVPSNEKPLAAENAPSNGKPNAEEKMKTK